MNLAQTIEKYHQEYDKNPKSKVFAPLADAYRKLGEHNQALNIAQNGLVHHPSFSGGHIVLGRVYMDLEQNIKAIECLEKACKLSPENILGQQLLADLYLKEQMVKKALASYKMVLFLKPNDKTAQERVKKLESLSADDFDQDAFKIKKINFSKKDNNNNKGNDDLLLARALSLADAFLVRNEVEKSFQVLDEAKVNLGEHPEIMKRLQLIDENIESRNPQTNAHSLAKRETIYLNENINYLQKLLNQIQDRKK